MIQMTTQTRQCEDVRYYPAGPHPGCAEFDGGQTFEVRCEAPATRHLTTTDERWPDEAFDWWLCEEHAAALRHEFATEPADVNIVRDEPVQV